MIKRRFALILVVIFGCIWIRVAHSQDQPEVRTLRVAVKPFPPFVMGQEGNFTGFSIDLWDAIAQELGLNYQFYGVATVSDQLSAVQNGDADAAIAGITITEQREEELDFTYPYFDSGLQIMVRQSQDSPIITTARAILSPAFLQYVAIFVVLIVVTAHLFWLTERRHPEFPQGYRRGVGTVLWWSTLTVLGYDDRPPGTRSGRLVAIIWMFAGVILIANLIAVLSAGATVRQLRSSVRSIADLRGQRVVTVTGTTSANYLTANGIPFQGVSVIDDAYALLLKGQADAVVYDSPVLRYYIASSGNPDLSIVGPVVETQKYGIALPTGSPYRKLINQATLRLQEDGTYDRIYQRWFGVDTG